jgi:hypothetical protein
MEPVSLTAGAIATLVLTKAIEKTGEKLGEKALEKGKELMQLLKRKSPNTASAIELAAQRPELTEQQPEDYSVYEAGKLGSIQFWQKYPNNQVKPILF